ncbi:hypothetical protein JW979_08590 [bacterium]|nr:hypothetical protein [candidate division CSSED10-310 bacterium]
MYRIANIAFISICITVFPVMGSVTIDGDFTDWTYNDLLGLDDYWGMTLGENPSYEPCSPIDNGIVPPGNDWTYLFDDGYDDSRDIVAFYVHMNDDQICFRIDFFDLKYQAESSSGLDVYVMIDCDPAEGEVWLPDFTDCQTDMSWDLAVCIYDTTYQSIKEGTAGQPEITNSIPVAFNANIDALEFCVSRDLFTAHGWNGVSPINCQLFTTKDGTNDEAGEIGSSEPGPGNSDLTDALVDDDRGFSDGILNGHISTDLPPPNRAKWAVVMHGNQPIANEDRISAIIDKFKDPYEPILGAGLYRALETAEITGQPIELHISGTLAMAAQWADPDFNARIQQDIQTGLVDLMGGVFAEQIMPFFHGDVNLQSIRLALETYETLYGVTAPELTSFWIPERVARGDFTEDIHNANASFGCNYQAVILDEFTHHHDWFGYDKVWNDIEGDDELLDSDHDVHKIHEYDGIKIFFIDRYAQKWKTEIMYPLFYDCEYEPSLQIGIRAKLLTLAMDDDPAQVLLCMEDWEDFAGVPYRQQASARNPDGFEIVTTWIASHPWIEMTTTSRILAGEVDLDGDSSGDVWDTVTDTPLINHLPPFYGLPMPPYWLMDTLPMDTYAWLRDAGEGNFGNDNPYPDFANVDNNPRNDDWDDGYHNWYYGSDNEFSFADTVPALKGWQYDRSGNGSYPAIPLPNGKSFHGMWQWSDSSETAWETGIIPETWHLIPEFGGGFSHPFWNYAVYTYMTGIYETGWHDEVTVRAITENEDDDDEKGILVHWVLPACNHLRDVNIIAEAIAWSNQSFDNQTTVSELKDVDLDGENEVILRNNRIFMVFENDGGRLVKAFTRSELPDSITEVIGASITYPDRGSEDENLDEFISIDPDASINRVSGFREGEYVNDVYLVNLRTNGVVFYSPDLRIRRQITLPDGSSECSISYELDESLDNLSVEFGFSPNPLDTVLTGKSALVELGGIYDDYIGLKNINNGSVYLRYGDAELLHRDNLERDRTCALTQRIVVNVEHGDTMRLGFGDPEANEPPEILFATITPNPASVSESISLTFNAWASGFIDHVMVYYGGTSTAPVTPFPLLEMYDDGMHKDQAPGDGIYGIAFDLPADILPIDRYIFSINAISHTGMTSVSWPFLHVSQTGTQTFKPSQSELLNILTSAQPVSGSMASAGSNPVITGGAYWSNDVTESGGMMRLYVTLQDPDGYDDITTVKLMYYGIDLRMYFTNLGNGIYGLEFNWPAGIPAGDYILEVQALDKSGNVSNVWPYWETK